MVNEVTTQRTKGERKMKTIAKQIKQTGNLPGYIKFSDGSVTVINPKGSEENYKAGSDEAKFLIYHVIGK